MKKLVVLFSVLALAFISCNKEDDNNDGELKEQEVTYAGTYAGTYKMADTTYQADVFFLNGLLKNRLNLYGIIHFEPTATEGAYTANIGPGEITALKALLGFVGVNVPDNMEEIVKCLNATANFDGEGKVNMKLDFDVDVNVGDTINLNWQLITYEGLRK